MTVTILAILLWSLCGFLAWGITLGDCTHRWPAFRHGGISLFCALIGPFGLFTTVVCGSWPHHWRLRRMTQVERWEAHKRLWSSLSYEDFLCNDK